MESPNSQNNKTPIVPEPADVQISEDQSGNVEISVKNRWSWIPSWVPWPSFSWKPTSAELLEKAELNMLSKSGVSFEQKFIKAGDFEINTIKLGSGPPLVLFHGFGAGVGLWVCNLKELSERHTVYAIDLPGFGRSSRKHFSGDENDAEEFFLQTLEHWRKEVGLSDFVLLGHSFGAYLAAKYSMRHPSTVQHLILADPWGVPRVPPEIERGEVPLRWKIVGTIASTFNPLAVIRVAGPYGPGLIAKFRKDLEMKFVHVYGEGTSVVSQYIYHLNAQAPSGETAFSALNQRIGWAKRPLIENIHELHEDIPVTLLYGSHTWMDRSAGRKAKDILGNRARILSVPDAGHHIYVDNFNFFNEQVLEAAKLTKQNLGRM